MALPLPRTVADVGPGGPLVTSMKGINALHNDMLLRKINAVKAQYAPLTTQAEAASKMAYANLLGPQFVAKLLGNNAAVANWGSDKSKEALNAVTNAGMGVTNGSNAINQIPTYSGVGQPSTNAKSQSLWDKLTDAFTHKPSQSTNAINQAPTQQNNMAMNQGSADQSTNGINHNLDVAWDNWLKSPEGQKELAKGPDNYHMPSDQYVMQFKNNGTKPTVEMDMTGGRREPTYGEKAAEYEGIQAEGKEAGKIRAKQREELDDQYQQAVQAEVPMEHLNEIVTNPLFRKLRRDGLFQKLQLDAKEITGTPEEKQLIGDFQTTALKALSESIMGWKGRILDKEVGISTSMKIGLKDSIDSMLGKMPSIEAFNEMKKQRARMASQIMRDKHISKGDALELADKQVNGKAIREKIQKQLNPSSVKNSKPDFTKMTDQQIHDWAEANGGRL